MIGAGDVRVSPLDMALAASVVDSGNWHAPSLVTGPDRSEFDVIARRRRARRCCRSSAALMRDACRRSGERAQTSAERLRAGGQRAVPGADHLWINWFVGYQGNIAFAVVELGKSPSASAAPLAGTFLRNLQTGS